MSSLLNIGQTGLLTAQSGLATSGHNVANASTPGYSRQVVTQTALAGQDMGAGFIGKGTQVSSVTRVYDEFLSGQLVTAQSAKSRLDTYYSQIRRLDTLVADPQTGVSPALQSFFKSVQNITADPNGAASRQAMLSSANSLVASFQTVSNHLSEMQAGINSEIKTSVSAINGYAQQIAKLNDVIEKASASAGSHPPNDLLDQRDQLVNDLAKEIKVSVVKQGNAYNVFIGNGQSLVMGTQTRSMVAAYHPTDPQRLQVAYATDGAPQILVESHLSGGRLGGLLEFRSQSLDATQNALGRMAMGLASTFNQQHRQGVTQSGAIGRDFFNVDLSTDVTLRRSDNSTITVTATVGNIGALTTSDYRLHYDGSNYTVTRLSDGETTTSPTLPAVDGLSFSTSGPLRAGDSFLIRPTAHATSSLKVAVTSTAGIAVAMPFVTGAPLANQGSGTISAGKVTNHAALLMNNEYEVVFSESGGTRTYEVRNLTAGTSPIAANTAYVEGQPITVDGMEFAISGLPANGDRFTIGPNNNREGDNRNAVLLGALQEKPFFSGGASYQGAYAQMVSTVGNLTREIEVTSAAAGKLHTQVFQAQQSVSGVNLDEEAANLIRYQQAYQAAGKIMQMATQLFDSLLQIGR